MHPASLSPSPSSAPLSRQPLLLRFERRVGLGIVIAAHLALLYCWSLSRPSAPPPGVEASNPIAWLRSAPARQPKTAPAPVPTRTAPPRPPARAAPGIAFDAAASAPAPVSTPDAPPAEPLRPPAPSRSADDILQQARHDIGRIDRDLRKELHEAPIPARVDTAQTRLQRGFDAAAQAVPNHWYEKPKVVEVMDEGGYGRKIYKVTGALGTYCVYLESNHAPDGIDVFQHGPNSKTATCPREK